MPEVKYLSDVHVYEFEKFMVLKNFSKRTIKTYIQIIGYSGDTDPPDKSWILTYINITTPRPPPDIKLIGKSKLTLK